MRVNPHAVSSETGGGGERTNCAQINAADLPFAERGAAVASKDGQ